MEWRNEDQNFYDIDEFKNPIVEGRKRVKVSRQSVFTDMNAMVDLAFLLLTFFMLTTTMEKPKSMEMVMPVPEDEERPADNQAVKESNALTLVPLPDNDLAVYRGLSSESVQLVPYGEQGLRTEINAFLAQSSEPVVIIKPHPESSYLNLVDLLDEMRISGVKRYALDDFSKEVADLLASSGLDLNFE